ncbi:hypothetical protein ACFSO7_19080 [Bacillus sp. CGMCC 1.16607]|uniref:hypothetical protein n=1 Tax=Bacillus sp. CGMCC 1.16607 TaxID=3351842 RepID=UPI0036418EC1
MNNRAFRSFGFGILFSVSIIGTSYLVLDKQSEKTEVTVEDAKNTLKKADYQVYTTKEFEEVKKEIRAQIEKETKENQAQNKNKAKLNNSPQKTMITYHLEIVSGMTSQDIVDRLSKAKLVKEPEKLQNYLDEHHYSTKIQLGVFELTSEMSFEQIAKTITKS